MTSLTHTHARANRSFFGATIAAVAGRITAWNDARITRKSLSNLSDHELDDIGLSRAEIEQIR